MAKIAFILLCHRDPDAIVRQAKQLTAAGDYIAIHFDARASQADFARITAELAENPNVVFANRRIKCGWGEWSLVQATLSAVAAAEKAFPRATHFYMVSGDCMAIKSATYAHQFLDSSDVDYIESEDFFESNWIRTGWKEERLIYRHMFNERRQRRLFYANFRLRQWLGLKRRITPDLRIMIGSQWWCLRRRTIEAVLSFVDQRPDVIRFFRGTWIPDETFFQTLVRHLVPGTEIRSRTLTFLMFSDYGMPVTFYNDHYDLLLAQDAIFARKISGGAKELHSRLGALYASDRTDFAISNEGRRLFDFLTGRGRIGRRFAPRFWETESSLGHDCELLIIACKKWHVAKRLVEKIRAETSIPALEYLFNESDSPLPNLGGIESSLAKRTRHRRALLRMLFNHYETKRMLICLDTANVELMQDFYSDRSSTRLLEIECEMSDVYLAGHARRVGLAGDTTPAATIDQILPTIRNEMHFESDHIRERHFPHHYRLREGLNPRENAAQLAAFLSVDEDTALRLAPESQIFAD